ncbi:hypothetical protein BGZ76_005662 [Entomortierella beljakovae]|nr:hypothetical protein BGZ76_005662 [Entomortierella beljakovae]
MSPPLSQESNTSLDLSLHHDPHQLSQHDPIHPLDPSNMTAPKKTLNWVNALPSHFDTAVSGHPRKRRRRTNREELEVLEDAFSRNLLPDAATRQELGDRLGMSVRAVQIWFQNRRQTMRKKSLGAPTPGTEEEMIKFNLVSQSIRRHSSGESTISLSSSLDGLEGGQMLKRGSKSCSNLLSSTQSNSTFHRSETYSTFPSTFTSFGHSTDEEPQKRLSSFSEPQIEMDDTPDTTMVESTFEPSVVVVKKEEIEPKSHELMSPVSIGSEDIVDHQTADRHLCMLLEEAKKSSVQKATPVMGIWSDTSSKVVLNPPVKGVFPTTATFPAPRRTMSTPTIKHFSNLSASSLHHIRPTSKSARKHRSMPDPSTFHSSNPSSPSFPPKSVSLMEQVINRQQLLRPNYPPSNFKQSALSYANKYSLDLICNKAKRSPPPSPPKNSSPTISAIHLARRLQYVVSTNMKRVQSESVIHDLRKACSGGGRCGQTAMRARRLSIGRFLFDSDTEEEAQPEKPSYLERSPNRQQQQQQQQQRSGAVLSYQAQKRRAGSTMSMSGTSSPVDRARSVVGDDDNEVDGDETDEEDFRQLGQARTWSPSAASLDYKRHKQSPLQGRERGGGVHRFQGKSLKSTLSTLSLVASSPTREYGLELERGQSPLTNFPILERNRTWNNNNSNNGHIMTGSPVTSMATERVAGRDTTEQKDLNMDELECANVLAGLGWGH